MKLVLENDGLGSYVQVVLQFTGTRLKVMMLTISVTSMSQRVMQSRRSLRRECLVGIWTMDNQGSLVPLAMIKRFLWAIFLGCQVGARYLDLYTFDFVCFVFVEWLIMLMECFMMLLRFLETYQLHPRNVTPCLRLEPAPEVMIIAYVSEICCQIMCFAKMAH